MVLSELYDGLNLALVRANATAGAMPTLSLRTLGVACSCVSLYYYEINRLNEIVSTKRDLAHTSSSTHNIEMLHLC